MSTGYSGTPLQKKLGIEAGMSVGVANMPDSFPGLLDPLPAGVELRQLDGPLDLAICFDTIGAALVKSFDTARSLVGPAGAIWVAWPKKASKVPTDITEDRLRDLFLPTGWVDIKVCAIDAVWSGLKFVLRRELR